MKTWHKLKANKTSSLPSVLIFYDTETTGSRIKDNEVKHKLKLGVVCSVIRRNKERDTIKWKVFHSSKEFWDFLLSYCYTKKRIYVFSHNQQFDFFIIEGFKWLSKLNGEIGKFIIDSQRFIIEFKIDKTKIVFVDSYNYVRTSLKKIGESIGLEKFDCDFNTVSNEDLEVYCKRDVEILMKFMLSIIDFISEYDLGCFKYTTPALCFNAYRHKFMKTPIFIHAKPEVMELERKSYRGGRNECFFIGKVDCDKIYKLDINSMYPYIMRENVYPSKFIFYEKCPSIKGLKNALKKFEVVADIDFEIDKPAIGIKQNKLLFPIGKLSAILPKPEIEYILENGKITNVRSYAIYESHDIFKDYVDFFYSLRKKFKKEGNEPFELMVKLYLNSLYGKFGEKHDIIKRIKDLKENITEIQDTLNYETGKREVHWIINGVVFKKVGVEDGQNSLTAISSYVTSYSRIYLWKLIEKAKQNNVYYCDTDSLFTNQKGYENLIEYIDSKKLGMMKVEGIYNNLIIHGCKDYVLDNNVVIKGVKKTAKWENEFTIKQEQFLKTKSLLRRKILDGVVIRDVEKHLSRIYDKGVVNKDGTVSPLLFS